MPPPSHSLTECTTKPVQCPTFKDDNTQQAVWKCSKALRTLVWQIGWKSARLNKLKQLKKNKHLKQKKKQRKNKATLLSKAYRTYMTQQLARTIKLAINDHSASTLGNTQAGYTDTSTTNPYQSLNEYSKGSVLCYTHETYHSSYCE